MHTKHILTALLIFPFTLWATGSKPIPIATSALQFQQLSDTRMTMGDNVISFVTGDLERMTLDANGNVGIRTTTPTDALEIGGDSNMNIRIGRWGALGILGNSIATVLGNNIKASNTDANMKYITTTTDGAKAIKMQYNEGITFHTQMGSVTAGSNFTGYERMRIDNNGNVGIGTAAPSHKLHVVGNVHASSFSAEPSFVWPDYVFEDSYELNELEQVEKYIEKNHHLPEIPSAAEVKENGVDIVSMQAKLLQKIEELTLYVIEQNKQIEDLQQQNLQMNKKIQTLVK